MSPWSHGAPFATEDAMPREPLLQRQTTDDDEERDLRPQRMMEMVGQAKVAERLRIALDAARKRGEPLGHILFDGPPGLGKTTFARCIPQELGVSLQIAAGAWLKAPKDVLPYLTNVAQLVETLERVLSGGVGHDEERRSSTNGRPRSGGRDPAWADRIHHGGGAGVARALRRQ